MLIAQTQVATHTGWEKMFEYVNIFNCLYLRLQNTYLRFRTRAYKCLRSRGFAAIRFYQDLKDIVKKHYLQKEPKHKLL